MNNHNINIVGEPMVDAKQAAAALSLPYYWFADQSMRSNYRIPHYLLGGLVRYRMSELSAWAAGSRTPRRDANIVVIAADTSDEGAQ